jgi:hypothetical protein
MDIALAACIGHPKLQMRASNRNVAKKKGAFSVM